MLIKISYCFKNSVNLAVNRTFQYNIYNYDTWINLQVNNTIEQILDFTEDSDKLLGFPTRVHVTSNSTLTSDHPLFITATQQKGVSSWELPLVLQTDDYFLMLNDMGRTLCPHDAGSDIRRESPPTVQLTTSSSANVSVDIKLKRVEDFYIELGKVNEVIVNPSSPRYYYFSFDQNPWNVSHAAGGPLDGTQRFNYNIPKSVILVIESDDEICATVSIQNNSCPVFDNEREVKYKGYHLTMSSQGGITLTQAMFPSGFYVVLIVRQSDVDCTGASETEDAPKSFPAKRSKTFRLKIIATISYQEYLVGALVSAALVLLVALFVLALLLPCPCRCTEEVTVVVEESSPSTSREDSAETDTQPILEAGAADESWSREHALTVGKLTRAPPDTLARRSDRYFWGALTLAVVYALPVVQLLLTYQRMVFQTGDQDLCYYNFLCAHPLGTLSDFNHVFSNVGYVLLGAVFAGQVRFRQVKSRQRPENLGIPQHYGLLYSMGLALSMEGLLSACYHLCPNKMNFQFDSSFMYVIAVLVTLKLYQNRHSDIIPSAHSTFMILAVIMTIGLFGILHPSAGFAASFTLLHLGACLVLTLKIYYAGRFKMDRRVLLRAYAHVAARGWRSLLPAHPYRAGLLGLANLANWSLAGYSVYSHHNTDLARQLLAILMGNAILYTMFYMVMKLVNRERILARTWMYCILAHVAWFLALRLFLDSKTKWSETPAQSRQHNAPCSSLSFYDTHDLWHGVSAAALFLSFNMLLTMDDALRDTPRDQIPTF